MREIDPKAYREEAERLRVKGYSIPSTDPLRQSYLDLANEYERLADLFDKDRQPNPQHGTGILSAHQRQ